MIFLAKQVLGFSNDDFEKIDNICSTFTYDNNINKSNVDVFYLNKFKYNLLNNSNFPIKKLEESVINLDIINKIFEGNNDIITDNSIYYNLNILKNIKHYNFNKNYLYIQNYKYFKILNYMSDTHFYRSSLILLPLTFGTGLKSNSYIYNIYKYIQTKSFNSYKSCIISLFYYFIGLIFSLICLYKYNSIEVLDSNISIIVSKLSSFVIVVSSYNNYMPIDSILSIKLINIINNSLHLCKHRICEYRPNLIGLTKYVLINNGIFFKLSFQETLKTLKTIALNNKIDWKVDSKSNIILSDFIPVGSGWYRYFYN